MIRFLQILLLSFLALNVSTQSSIPLPSFKEDLYPDHSKHYFEGWIDRINTLNEIVSNPANHDWEYVTQSYYNRFNAYYKAIPDNKSDILHIFFDGIENDKDAFCNTYDEAIRPRKILDWTVDIYGRELTIMDKLCECIMLSYNSKLISRLKLIKERDQKFRTGKELDMVKQHVQDSINTKEIEKILDEYGYPNIKLVGIKYERHLWLAVLHSKLELMEKCLPIIKNEIDNKRLTKTVYPNLYDRIELLNGRPQKFGTQSTMNELGEYELYKLLDKEKVNEWRKEYNLPSLEYVE